MKYSNIMANDMNPFNIGIIGLSRSGKSVLMHSLGWGQSHSDYIKFYAKDMKTSLALRKTLECLEEGRWPCATNETKQLNYTMTYKDCPVIDFSVTDYKGIILNSYDEISRKERREFYKYLENSAGLIFCVPSDTIIRILNGDDDAVEELEDLNDFIFKNRNIIKNIPVTIAITKSDLLENENEKQAACEIIKEEFALFCEGNQLFVSLVFVTLGEGLGDGEQGSKITTENIYCRPMSDAFYFVLYNITNQLIKKIGCVGNDSKKMFLSQVEKEEKQLLLEFHSYLLNQINKNSIVFQNGKKIKN